MTPDNLSPAEKRKVSAGLPVTTEADIFGGEITELGRERHVPTPVNTTLWRIIKAREGMWDGNRKDDNGK